MGGRLVCLAVTLHAVGGLVAPAARRRRSCAFAEPSQAPFPEAADAAESTSKAVTPEVLTPEVLTQAQIEEPFSLDDLDLAGLDGLGAEDEFDMDSYLSKMKGVMEEGGGQGAEEGSGEGYKWRQDWSTMSVEILGLPEGTRHYDVDLTFPTVRTIQVLVDGEPFLQGQLGGEVNRDETFWVLEDGEEDDAGSRKISLYMTKGARQGIWVGFLASEAAAKAPDVS